MRMVHLRRRMKAEEAARDPKLARLFKLRRERGEVVVELTQAGSCPTCDT